MVSKILNKYDLSGKGSLGMADVCGFLSEILEERAVREASRLKFEEMDKDGSGFLESHELTLVAEWVISTYFLFEAPEGVKERLLGDVEVGGEGRMDFEAFNKLFSRILSKMKVMERARGTFVEVDDGYLQGEQLRDMVQWALSFYQPEGVGYLTAGEREEYKTDILRAVDQDKQGKVNYGDFIELFERECREKTRRLSAITEPPADRAHPVTAESSVHGEPAPAQNKGTAE